MNPASSSEPTPQRLMQFAFGYAPPLLIESGVKIGVFDFLDAAPAALEDIHNATGASLRGLRGLLNALVGIELLAKEGDRYALTAESAAFLVKGKPGFHGGFFQHTTTQLLPKWMQLETVVRTGKPATAVNQVGPGSEFFEMFVEGIFPMSYRAALAAAGHLQVGAASSPVSVLDLATGSGVWGVAFAQQSPQVRVTAVDWPGVLKVTRRIADRFQLGDRFAYVEGDLHDADFGRGHQVATLGHILHSEGEAQSKSLLRKTFEALAPGGTIVIAEFVPNEERTGPPMALTFAVNMLVNSEEGDTFTFGEIGSWLREAGFADVRQLEAPAPSPLILATKPR